MRPRVRALAALNFVASRPSYAAVHVVALFAALVTLSGLIALASSMVQPGGAMRTHTRQIRTVGLMDRDVARAGVRTAREPARQRIEPQRPGLRRTS